jgi:hypothetical protein
MRRERLPNRRETETIVLDDAATGGSWVLSVGYDHQGRVREVFVDRQSRGGSPLDSLMHDVCILVSRELLQCGRGLSELIAKLAERPPSLVGKLLVGAATLERERARTEATRAQVIYRQTVGEEDAQAENEGRRAPGTVHLRARASTAAGAREAGVSPAEPGTITRRQSVRASQTNRN